MDHVNHEGAPSSRFRDSPAPPGLSPDPLKACKPLRDLRFQTIAKFVLTHIGCDLPMPAELDEFLRVDVILLMTGEPPCLGKAFEGADDEIDAKEEDQELKPS